MSTNQTKVITGPGTRWSYVHVWEPREVLGGEPRYSVSLLIPKEDTVTLAKVGAAVQAAYLKGQDRLRWTDGTVPELSELRLPLLDGDDVGGEYAGCCYLQASSRCRPGIVDGECRPVTERSQVYSGVYGRASVTFFAYNRNGNRGIGCGLNNLQKLRDGEAMGRATAAEDFGAEAELVL